MSRGDRPTPPDPVPFARIPLRPAQDAPAPEGRRADTPFRPRVVQPGLREPEAPRRAPPLERTLSASPAPPSGRIDVEWHDEVTGRGVPHPPGKRPPRSTSPPPFELAESPSQVHSSREGALKAVIDKLEREKDEAIRGQIEAQFRRPPTVEIEQPAPSAKPRAPSLSLGDARWWVLVLGALVGVLHEAPKAVESLSRWLNTPSHEQLDALAKRIDDTEAAAKKRQEANDKAQAAAADQARIVEAFLCAQGLRADGLDCDVALARAKFEPQPLTGPNKVRGAPQWKTRLVWPQPP